MPTKPPGTPDLDLTDPNTFGFINDAVFMTASLQPAGTGNFDTFVQIQHNGTEQGYNTDASAQYDEKNSHNHNHSILLAEVPIVIGDGQNGTIEGAAYREFLLDVNEPNGGYISLDALQIWQGEAGNLTNFTPGAGFAGAHTNYLAYDLDAGGDRWIALDAGGSGQGDYRILIPDSFFINDADHRYVTLYSAFGEQPGWESGGGFEEWGTAGPNGGTVSAIAVDKTATVDGGTADQAGEVISYSIKISNVGNQALTGVTVSDPFVSNLAGVDVDNDLFNDGDVNEDGKLSAGETWQYTASYTVTQSDIDNGGTTGDGTITNTVTADTNETSAVSDTTSVTVEQNPSLLMTKSADVSLVDEVADVINYTINVQNVGSSTLFGLTVNDPLFAVFTPILVQKLGNQGLLTGVLNGDYNAGDTNQNGVEDPGETFQYTIIGDENNNGIQDPGETFIFANAGDTNRNGLEDPGETFQFANAGDTNQNGVEDPGETFQFTVNDQVAGVDGDFDGFNDGDLNEDGALNVGETWQFAASYTVTQDDIDNGGIFNPALPPADPDDPDDDGQPGLTLDNTATATTNAATAQASASVLIDQNPHLTVDKTASVPGGTADAAGEVISYTITVTNDGNMTLTGVTVDDSFVNLTFTGDPNGNGKLDLGEIWQYTGSYAVTQDDIDNGGVVDLALAINNTATVTTDQVVEDEDGNPIGAMGSDSASVVIDQNPHVTVVKAATVPGGTADAAGEVISYTIAVTNDGNMTLTDVQVSDLSATGLAAVLDGLFNAGDLDTDGKLDLGETWQYTASHTVTQAQMDGGGTILNTASVTSDQGPVGSGSASVTVAQNPALTIEKTGTWEDGADADGFADSGETVHYTFAVTNNGNVSLDTVALSDTLLGAVSGPVSGDTVNVGVLDVGETWTYSADYIITAANVTAGTVHNEVTATAAGPQDQPVSDTDTADVALPQPPPNPALTLTKEGSFVNTDEIPGAQFGGGDLIQYIFRVANTGNVALSSVLVNDSKLGGPLSNPNTDTGVVGVLDVGEIWVFDEFYILTQADVDDPDHTVHNDATVTALDPSNQAVNAAAFSDTLLPF
jgi:uncharacterized repeat protein (TIGR01451 family)